jgi:hypothetical protein
VKIYQRFNVFSSAWVIQRSGQFLRRGMVCAAILYRDQTARLVSETLKRPQVHPMR